MIRRAHSYVIAAAIWGIPGINIAVKGFRTYMLMNPDDLWWLMLITIAVSIFFFIIFRPLLRPFEQIIRQPIGYQSFLLDDIIVIRLALYVKYRKVIKFIFVQRVQAVHSGGAKTGQHLSMPPGGGFFDDRTIIG